MPISNSCFRVKFAILCLLAVVQASVIVTPFLPQSFFFDWNTPGQPVPIPTTEQCQTIHITWSRSTAVGPNPTAPYYLQVYTSAYTIPLVIPAGDGLSYDWAVPFAPGTLYQICMFDKFGNTGGCQATYTVIPPSSLPTCANVTLPLQLGVQGKVDNGPISRFGWIDQCTSISLQPTNGTAPYILTVAPALHPPYNITSYDTKPINWTVSLSWASPFFISLVDADGSMWSNGPLHAGGGGTIACLAGNVTSSSSKEVGLPIVVGSGVGGLAVGILVGILAAYLFLKRKYKKKLASDRFVDITSPGPITPHSLAFDHDSGPGQYRPVPTVSSSGILTHPSNPSSTLHRMGPGSTPYQVEPFSMPDEEGRHVPGVGGRRMSYAPSMPAHAPSTHESMPRGAATAQSQVYVLHHDSQQPPVTIFHQDGTQIVELPPRYPPFSPSQSETLSEGRSASDSRSDGARTDGTEALILHQARQPNQPRKLPRSP